MCTHPVAWPCDYTMQTVTEHKKAATDNMLLSQGAFNKMNATGVCKFQLFVS